MSYEYEEFERQPRENIKPPELNDIQIDDPPIPIKKQDNNLLSTFMQCIVAALNFSLVSFVIAKDLNTTLLCTAIAAAGSLLSSFITYSVQKIKVDKTNKMQEIEYAGHIKAKKNDILTNREIMDQYYITNYPCPEECVRAAFTKSSSRHLWDRQIQDADFMMIRIGNRKTREFIVNANNNCKYSNPEQKDAVNTLISSTGYTESAPVLIDAKNRYIGVIGVVEKFQSLICDILVDVSAHQCYTDVSFIFLSSDNSFEWTRYIRYFENAYKNMPLHGSKKTEIEEIMVFLRNSFSARVNMPPNIEISAPYFVVFVLDDIEMSTIDSELFSYCCKNGIPLTVFLFRRKYDELPKSIDIVIKCDESNGKLFIDKNDPITFDYEKTSLDMTADFFYRINSFHVNRSYNSYMLPNIITLHNGYGVQTLDELNISQRWKLNRRIKSLAVPVGLGEDGKELVLNIHENCHGPHGVVVGTVGSGKSVFFASYILSLIINYSPRDLNLVLFDYKGGVMSYPFTEVPHVIKIFTDEDDMIEDANYLLTELTRRRMILYEAGNYSIDEYNESSPHIMPRLVIIIDEIAVIKEKCPDALKDILSIACIGRSLGIHLILGTQIPSTIDDQIYSNAHFKICLKVDSIVDSNAIIKNPMAAYLDNPGRGYILVNHFRPFMFQTYWSGQRERDCYYLMDQTTTIVEHIKKKYQEEQMNQIEES